MRGSDTRVVDCNVRGRDPSLAECCAMLESNVCPDLDKVRVCRIPWCIATRHDRCQILGSCLLMLHCTVSGWVPMELF